MIIKFKDGSLQLNDLSKRFEVIGNVGHNVKIAAEVARIEFLHNNSPSMPMYDYFANVAKRIGGELTGIEPNQEDYNREKVY